MGEQESFFLLVMWFQGMASLKSIEQAGRVKFQVRVDVTVLNALKTGNSGRIFVLQSGEEFLLLWET